MTNEINLPPEVPDEAVKKEEKKAMKSCFSRCGWGVFTMVCAMLAVSLVLGMLVSALVPQDVYNKYMLFFNEGMIAIAMLCGAAVLCGMPKAAPEKTSASAKEFFALLCICATVSTVGSLISNYILSFFNAITGGSASDPVTNVLMSIDPWQMLICTGIIAPVLEELFFRKMLIDRMRRFGEPAAVLVSALLFALFHQNISQLFYTFGLGVILAYLYCRTGRYSIVTLMHMAFNCFFGVIPAILTKDILPLLESLSVLPEEELLEVMPTVLAENALPLLLFLFYLLVRYAFTIAGLVFFVLNIKKAKLAKAESSLSGEEKAKATLLNAGMIAAAAINFIFMIVSLITS